MKWTPERIRKLRKRLGYTQSEMAEELGYRRYQTVLEFETGKRTPPQPTQRLLDVLEERTGEPSRQNEDE